MKEYTGHTVLNGELKHASVSSVKLFDARTKGGCARRWAWEKVFGLKVDKDKNKEAKDKGTALDKELKHYLATGDKSLSTLALRGLHILEAPGPDLKLDVAINTVEHWHNGVRLASLPEGEHDKYPLGTQHIVRSALTADGIPFVGELDVAHERGHWRDEDGEYHQDPPGTVEVGDIKYKGNTKDRHGNSILMLPSDLIRDIQMAGYGEWVSRVRPNTTHVRASLLVFPEKDGGKVGTARKITRLHVLEDYRHTWARVEVVVREMKDVARVKDIEHVPGAASIDTCDAYGGCPHREYCTAYKRNSLDKTYGKVAEDYLQQERNGVQGPGGLQALGWIPSGTSPSDRGGFPIAQQGQPGAPRSAISNSPQPVREGPGEDQSSSASQQLVQAAQGLPIVVGAISRATPFPEPVLRDLSRSVRQDQNEVQSPHAGTFSQRDAFSRGDVSQLQSPSRPREGQPDRAQQRDSISERYLTMGLLASNPQMMQQPGAQVPQQQAPQQPQPDMRQQLANEEQQMRQQVAQQQQQMPQQLNTAELAQVCQRLTSYGYGFPALGGNAAQAFGVLNGQQIPPGATYAGITAPAGAMRSLHGIQLTEVAHIYQLEGELAREKNGTPAPQQVAQQVQQYVVQGTQAPSQNPPVQVQAQPYQQTATPQGSMTSFVAPDAPQSMPQLAMQQSAPPQQYAAQVPQAQTAPDPMQQVPQSQPAPEAPKKGRGRPKATNVQGSAPPPIAVGAPGASTPPTPAPASPVAAAAGPTFTPTTQNIGSRVVLVNCRTEDFTTSSLASYVDYINTEVAKKYNVGKDGRLGILDVRAAVDGSVLGYGGWKGAVREIVKVDQPGDGLYHIDTHRDDLTEAVVDGLRQAGWLIIRGVFS